MAKKHILVLGAGSVGKRHLKNFSDLGCEVSAMDPREDRLEDASGLVPLRGKFTRFEEALSAERIDGVVVGSPPKFHVKQCILAARLGHPILLEKPLSPSLSDALSLKRFLAEAGISARILMGYTYRWWPPLGEFRKRLMSGQELGKPLHAKFVMSANLADWHPWERYQDFFMASKELGGGALLDESHFIDLMLWFFGMPKGVFAKVEHLSSLEIETDDNVDILVEYEGGLRVSVHLDLYGRPHEKFISVTGENCTMRWSFDPNQICFSREIEMKWDFVNFNFQRNDMFVNVAQEFIDIIDGKATASCSLEDGINVLSVLEACRESSAKGMMVPVKRVEQ